MSQISRVSRPLKSNFHYVAFFVLLSIAFVFVFLPEQTFFFFEVDRESFYWSEINFDHLELFPVTNFSEAEKKVREEFWDALQISFQCPNGSFMRVGHKDAAKDGDKWMCGVVPLHGRNCSVYSFGVNDDSYFEAKLLKMTNCNIYAYDPTVEQIGKPLRKTKNPRLKFSKIGVGHTNEERDDGKGTKKIIKTIKTLMQENGQLWIDILKMDVEGSEYATLYKFLDDFNDLKILPVGQLLVELHHGDDVSYDTGKYGVVQPLIRALERKGLRLFHVEKNQWYPKCCAELSFLNVATLSHFVEEGENVELLY